MKSGARCAWVAGLICIAEFQGVASGPVELPWAVAAMLGAGGVALLGL